MGVVEVVGLKKNLPATDIWVPLDHREQVIHFLAVAWFERAPPLLQRLVLPVSRDQLMILTKLRTMPWRITRRAGKRSLHENKELALHSMDRAWLILPRKAFSRWLGPRDLSHRRAATIVFIPPTKLQNVVIVSLVNDVEGQATWR